MEEPRVATLNRGLAMFLFSTVLDFGLKIFLADKLRASNCLCFSEDKILNEVSASMVNLSVRCNNLAGLARIYSILGVRMLALLTDEQD